MPNNRFSMPGIRAQILMQKSIEQSREKEKQDKLEQERREAAEQKIRAEKNKKILLDLYGRKMLEAAIQGHVSLETYDFTSGHFDLIVELAKRGFFAKFNGSTEIAELDVEQLAHFDKHYRTSEQKIAELTEKQSKKFHAEILEIFSDLRDFLDTREDLYDNYQYFSKLELLVPKSNQITAKLSSSELLVLGAEILTLPKLVSKTSNRDLQGILHDIGMLVKELGDDNSEITNVKITWEYPDITEESIRDCINAKFLDWVSDIHGSKLLSEVFSLIETQDLEGKKTLSIPMEKHYGKSEYTDDESKVLLEILGIDVPFNISCVRSMFSILGYTTSIEKDNSGNVNGKSEIVISWD